MKRSVVRWLTRAVPAICVALTCNEPLASEPNVHVTADPPWIALLVGDSARVTVSLRTAPGEPLHDSLITWRSSSPAQASISATGVVRAGAHGIVTISAETPAGLGTATVIVAPPTLVGAGDIASCKRDGDEQTAALLDQIPGIVLPLGDNVYENGSLAEYNACYHSSWGRHRARSRPVPGNHDYQTPDAAGYYSYFGVQAGDSGIGYYSWDFAGWHLVALNSNISMAAGSPQEVWLRADLAAHSTACTLAYWHHPLFSSTTGRRRSDVRPLWTALRDAGADVALVGHAHNYERFAPQDSDGNADARGLRQFVVGTGGTGFHAFDSILAPNNEAGTDASLGVLALSLGTRSYSWRFVPVPGAAYSDSGTVNCR